MAADAFCATAKVENKKTKRITPVRKTFRERIIFGFFIGYQILSHSETELIIQVMSQKKLKNAKLSCPFPNL